MLYETQGSYLVLATEKLCHLDTPLQLSELPVNTLYLESESISHRVQIIKYCSEKQIMTVSWYLFQKMQLYKEYEAKKFSSTIVGGGSGESCLELPWETTNV